MYNKKLLALAALLLLAQQLSFAKAKKGQAKIDSLFSVLSTAKEDTSKLRTLRLLVREFRYTNQDTAFYFGKEALALAYRLNYEEGIADVKLGLSGLYADKGKWIEGLEFGNDALSIYQKLHQSPDTATKKKFYRRMANALGNIGQNRIVQGNYPEALRNTFLALKIAEELEDKDGIATYEWNIGNIYNTQHNHTEALKHYNVCLEISLESGVKNDISACYGAVGFTHFQGGNYDEALKNYSTALKLAEEGKDDFTLAEIYIAIGEIKEKLGDYSEALKYDFAALKLHLKIGIEQQVSLAYIQIGSVYTKQKNYASASEYFAMGLKAAKESSNIEYLKMSYENLAILDSARGNFKKALENYKQFITYRDSLLNQDNTKKLVQQQMQYDFDKKEAATKANQVKKDVIALEEAKQQRTIRNYSFAGIAALILFGGFTYSRYVQRKKLSNQLAHSLTELKQTQTQLIQLEKEKEAEAIRLRISRDIHDDIGSNLTKIAMLGNLASAQSKNKMPEMTAQLNEISNYARTVNSSMSEIIWAVNPKQDTLENLLAYMRLHTEEFLKDTGINHQINFPEIIPAVQLNPDLKRSLFLVLKESLNNAVKYAEAKNITVALKTREVSKTSLVSFQMQIADDGKGFDLSEIKNNKGGNGLQNLEARMQQSGCSFNLQSTPGDGCSIEVKGIL